MSKIDEFKIRISALKSDIILLSETWMHMGIPDQFVQLQGYRVKVEMRPEAAAFIFKSVN